MVGGWEEDAGLEVEVESLGLEDSGEAEEVGG